MSEDADFNTVLTLLQQPYELEPAAVAALAELVLEFSPKKRQRLIFLALDSYRTPVDRLNMSRVLQALVETDRSLVGVLKHSMKPGGRCPAGARPVIVAGLGLKPEPQEILRPTAILAGDGNAAHSGDLLLNPTTTSFYALPKLFDALAGFGDRDGRLTVRVREFVYASGLAIVATWANAKGMARNVVPEDRYTRSYLQRIGFNEAMDGVETKIDADRDDWSVCLTVIRPESRVQDVTARIVDILTTFVNPTAEDRASFGILLGELIENVSRHARAESPGFIVAQVYPKQFKLGITIADPGIGIKASFIEGEVEEYRRPTDPDAAFISLALKPLVTSKVSGHAGYGLYILSELIRRNGGTYAVTSGTNTVVGYRVRGQDVERVYNHASWQGTVATMIVNLQNKLPLNEVYTSLPLPKGYTVQDFFDD